MSDRQIVIAPEGPALLESALESFTVSCCEVAATLSIGAERYALTAPLVVRPAARADSPTLWRLQASAIRDRRPAEELAVRLARRTGEPQPGPQAKPAEHRGRRRSRVRGAQQLNRWQLVATMSFLRQVELFRELPPASLANLAGIAQEVIVYQGDVLFEEGEEGESLYLVCGGALAIVAGERQVATLQRGACVGEMALISGLPRSASAMALSEGRLLRIGSDDFMSLLASETDIALGLLKTLAQRLRQVSRA